jgi:plastocyanin domain-containing protein
MHCGCETSSQSEVGKGWGAIGQPFQLPNLGGVHMTHRSTILGGIATLSVLLGATAGGAIAQMSHENMKPTEQTGAFQRIEQPLWVKGAVTAGGLGLIGLELWWFLFSKPKSRRVKTQGGVQEVTVIVDGGYEPSQIVVRAGQLVRLNFDRKDPSSCLGEVRFPDFHIAQNLLLDRVTPIEFTPDKPGKYEFTCGMNMFRGVVDVRSDDPDAASAIAPVSQTTHPVEHPATPTSLTL